MKILKASGRKNLAGGYRKIAKVFSVQGPEAWPAKSATRRKRDVSNVKGTNGPRELSRGHEKGGSCDADLEGGWERSRGRGNAVSGPRRLARLLLHCICCTFVALPTKATRAYCRFWSRVCLRLSGRWLIRRAGRGSLPHITPTYLTQAHLCRSILCQSGEMLSLIGARCRGVEVSRCRGVEGKKSREKGETWKTGCAILLGARSNGPGDVRRGPGCTSSRM
jgi:hypothetical protein